MNFCISLFPIWLVKNMSEYPLGGVHNCDILTKISMEKLLDFFADSESLTRRRSISFGTLVICNANGVLDE